MQDNEYTDAQVGDARGLFELLDPVPCGTVPAYLIQCSSSSLHHSVLQVQPTSSSASDPVYFIQCCSCSLAHPALQFQSTSSSALVPFSLLHLVLQLQSPSFIAPIRPTSSSVPVAFSNSRSTSSSVPMSVYLIQYSSPEDFNFSLISCSIFLFLCIFFLSNFTYFE